MKRLFTASCFLLCLMGGCWKKFTEKIDIDVSIDYVKTNSDGSTTCVELIELDNIEEVLN